MVRQDDVQFRLDAFQGPLDLLLYLIRRAEVDIQDIPIAAITDQYHGILRVVDDIDIELAGEFLVMSATLIEIKSRTIAPPEQAEDGESAGDRPDGMDASDPRYELVQQLLAYQRYRIASEEMDERRLEFAQRFPVRTWRPQFERYREEQSLELEDAHPMDLADAYERILETVNFDRLGDHRVEFDDTPIELYEEDLLDRLSRDEQHSLTLQSAFEGQKPMQRIGLFMAMLELIRMRRILVEQDSIDGDITVSLRASDDDALVIASHPINRHEQPTLQDDVSGA